MAKELTPSRTEAAERCSAKVSAPHTMSATPASRGSTQRRSLTPPRWHGGVARTGGAEDPVGRPGGQRACPREPGPVESWVWWSVWVSLAPSRWPSGSPSCG